MAEKIQDITQHPKAHICLRLMDTWPGEGRMGNSESKKKDSCRTRPG